VRNFTLIGVLLTGLGFAGFAAMGIASADELDFRRVRVGTVELQTSVPGPGLTPWLGGAAVAAGLMMMVLGLRLDD
jgi:hypothetical protein